MPSEPFFRTQRGEGRTRVCLDVWHTGNDLVAHIYNDGAHLGAVSVSEFDTKSGRNSVSTITLLGHKDDALTREAAYLLGKHTRRNICVIAGVHIDNITQDEIARVGENTRAAVKDAIAAIKS